MSLFVFWGLSSHWALATLRPSENHFLPAPASSSLQPIPAGTSEPAAALAFHPSDPCQSSPLLSEKKQKHSSSSPKASSGAALSGILPPLRSHVMGIWSWSSLLRGSLQYKHIQLRTPPTGPRNRHWVQKLGSQTYFLQPHTKSCLSPFLVLWLLLPLFYPFCICCCLNPLWRKAF